MQNLDFPSFLVCMSYILKVSLHKEYTYFFPQIISFKIIYVINFLGRRIYICHTDTSGTILKKITRIYPIRLTARMKINTDRYICR